MLGMIGAALGAELGKAFDGKRLLVLFGLLMIGVGLSMLRERRTAEAPNVRLTRDSAATLLPDSCRLDFAGAWARVYSASCRGGYSVRVKDCWSGVLPFW